jgi:TrkA-N domain/RyR domain
MLFSLPNLARRTWATVALAGAAFALGLAGYLQASTLPVSSAVYDTLGLFTLSLATPPGVNDAALPLSLDIARFLAPLVTVLAALSVVAHLLRDNFDLLGARRARDHTVVCGLGQVGTTIVRQLRAAGHQVVAIERDTNAAGVAWVRELGVPIVVGDARSSEAFHRARVDRAARVVWAADAWVDGSADLSALTRLLGPTDGRARAHGPDADRASVDAPSCLLRVKDMALCTSLRRQMLARTWNDTAAVDVDVFNEFENAAQRLLWHTTRNYASATSGAVRLALVGSGSFTEAVLVQAARNWWGVPRDRARPELTIEIYAPDATDLVARVGAVWPELLAAAHVVTHDGAVERVLERTDVTADAAYVLLDDQERALDIGLVLVQETCIRTVAIIGPSATNDWSHEDRLVVVDPVASGLQSDVLLIDTYELLGRMLHEHYGLSHRIGGDGALLTGDDPRDARREWHALDPIWRASNRDAARALVPNLRTSGYELERLGARAMPTQPSVADDDVDALAEREHERWRRFMTAHGWRPGPVRDLALRSNPDLVPWRDASSEGKDYTRQTVQEYPRLLAQLGYQLVRHTP